MQCNIAGFQTVSLAVVASVIVAVAFPRIEAVLGLIGATCSVSLSFVIPRFSFVVLRFSFFVPRPPSLVHLR